MSRDELEGLMLMLDGALEPADEAMLRARLVDDPALAEQWRALQLMQSELKIGLQAELSPDFTAGVMKKVRQSQQVSPGLMHQLLNFLSRPIAIPIAASAAFALMWAVGMPKPSDNIGLQAPSVAAETSPAKKDFAFSETEIESIDNPTNINVLVLAAPGSRNRVIWLSQRNISDEG
jgi:anti-sigma factor RsiW